MVWADEDVQKGRHCSPQQINHSAECPKQNNTGNETLKLTRCEDATNIDAVIAQKIARCAVTCKSEPTDIVRAYVEAGIAPATRRAYKADLEHFRAWGGDVPTTG